ncbi:MAG TPA: RES family NAD+ phosphorylase [Candidatus Saccharimonadales bacterium]|nr:RES family NAD+ phosphorylase [Candidatus Saccharimonadales bacterium]
MKIKPNPRYDAFVAELRKLKRRFSKWEGVAFRAAPLEFARLARLLDGKGGLQIGGRWLAAGNFCAVNLSTTQETALKESNANFTYYNFALSDVKPKMVVGVRLKLKKVIDLANPRGVRAQPWLLLDELLAEDWRKINDAGHESQSQAFGRAVHDVGAEALLAPSVRVLGGTNLVHFPGSVASSSSVEIFGEQELQRWLKKR